MRYVSFVVGTRIRPGAAAKAKPTVVATPSQARTPRHVRTRRSILPRLFLALLKQC
jgi:hypothetical protein